MKRLQKLKELCKGTHVADMCLVYPSFTLTDGRKMNGFTHWMDKSVISCLCGQYQMHEIKSDGYIYGNDGLMYLLQNIVSIEWRVADVFKAKVIDEFCKVYYDDDEAEKLREAHDES